MAELVLRATIIAWRRPCEGYSPDKFGSSIRVNAGNASVKNGDHHARTAGSNAPSLTGCCVNTVNGPLLWGSIEEVRRQRWEWEGMGGMSLRVGSIIVAVD
jgi:hypothetical protein